MPRTFLVNAVDVALAAPVAAPDLTITVDDATPLPPVPFYLVVDPFNDTDGREYMLCTDVVGDVLTVTRDLEGTDSLTHQTNDIVRITIAQQHIDDLWDSVEAGGLPVGGGQGDSLRKLSATDGDAEFRVNATFDIVAPATPLLGDFWMDLNDIGPPGGGFLPLGGGTMSGDINMDGNALSNVRGMVGQSDADIAIRMIGTGGLNLQDASFQLRFRIGPAPEDSMAYRAADGTLIMILNATNMAMSLPIGMGSNKITAMADPTAAQDAATKAYVDGFLPLSGGQMSGNILMDGNNIQEVANLIGTTTVAMTVRPGAGQRLVFRDDAGSRFIIEPTANGDMSFYDTSTAVTMFWDESASLWKFLQNVRSTVDVTLTTRAMRNIIVQSTEPNSPNIGDVWMDNS